MHVCRVSVSNKTCVYWFSKPTHVTRLVRTLCKEKLDALAFDNHLSMERQLNKLKELITESEGAIT